MYDGSYGGTFYSEDNENFYGADFVDSNTGYVVGDGKIIKTTDGGVNWLPLTSGSSSDLHSVDFINSNIGWAVGNSGTILKNH